MSFKMALQSGMHGLHITFLAGILKISFGQNECPETLYVKDIELEEGQAAVLIFDGFECNVTIEERDDSDGFNDLHIVLLIVAAVGFLLWLSTICIAFFICCYKRKRKDQEHELKLLIGRPHCAPPCGPAPHPEGNPVKELEEDDYARAPQRKENQPPQPATKLNDQLLVSKADRTETSKDDDSVKSHCPPEYLEPKPMTNKTATPLTNITANPPTSTSVTEHPPHQPGRDLGRPETRSSKRSDGSNNPSVSTDDSVCFQNQLNMVLSARAGNGARDGPSTDGVNGNLNITTSSDEKRKEERNISDELQYDAVEY